MRRYRIDVSYDGTSYAGWQIQPNAVTVQQKLEAAISKLTREKVKVHGSGRTDQGVHAKLQVAHFDMNKALPAVSLRRGLNALLPADIRILNAKTAEPGFHARRSALSKEYRYFIWNAEIMPPFLRKYRTHVKTCLDTKAMAEAASYLVGHHDFTSFTANPNRKIEVFVRQLLELRVVKHGSEIVFIASGNGFLYRMVRSIAGFLIRVGEGAVAAGETQRILRSCTRTGRVPTAPPEGLFLWKVRY